jgi:hypothetical protein
MLQMAENEKASDSFRGMIPVSVKSNTIMEWL